MSIDQPRHCFSCKRALEQSHSLAPDLIRQTVWVSPLERQIGFCEQCYDHQLFDGLELDEISALHWAFGRCDAEDSPDIIQKKIARLLLAVEGAPCGEVFAALAHAYHLAGQMTEAR